MKNIPTTFLGLLHITTLWGVATQCLSLEKVEKPGDGSVAPLYVPIAIIFPKASNREKTGWPSQTGHAPISSNFICNESLLVSAAVWKQAWE